LAITNGAAHHPMSFFLFAETDQAIQCYLSIALSNDPIKMVTTLVGLITILAFWG
jgi:hypothetical protein